MDKEPRMTGRPEEAGEEYGTARYTPERRGGRGEAGYNTLRYDPGRFNINEPRPEPARQSLTHHSVRPAAHTSKPAAGERFDEEPDDAGYAERSAAKERYDERPKVKERYDERPKTKEHYDERPKTKERYDERPKAKERYDERPKTDERYDERHKTDERYDERPSPSARAPASRRRDEDPRARERYSGAPSRERYEEEPPRERYPERPPQREREAYGSDGKGYPPRKPAGRKKKYKSRVAAFYTAAIFCGALVMIVVFLVVFKTMSGSGANPGAVKTPSPTPSPTLAIVQEIGQLTGVIQAVDAASGQVTLLDPGTGQTYACKITAATTMMDKYHNQLKIDKFAVGDIVDASFDVSNSSLTEMTESAQCWQALNKKGVVVDTDAQTITIANDVYNYTDALIVTHDGGPYGIADVTDSDTVTVSGMLSQAWVLDVVKSHGYLQINNIGQIQGGTVEVDNDTLSELSADTPITLSEGAHHVVVKGINIDPYVQDVTIVAGETLFMDVGGVSIKTGLLNLAVNVSGYTLMIDGAVTDATTAINLGYGSHLIHIEADGYDPYDDTVTVDQPIVDLSVSLNATVKIATVTIASNVPGASVYIDNGLVGQAPAQASVEFGDHTVMVMMDGYDTETENITVDSSVMVFEIDLTPTAAETIAPPDNTPDESTPTDTPGDSGDGGDTGGNLDGYTGG